MTVAFKVALPTMQKFVLVALCDSANDQGECYPSISALADKCSMGLRTVQEAIVALESGGHLRRDFRKGRSTVYWLHPCASPQGGGESHYVYRITDPETQEFYIGARTCRGDPAQDGYMGSGAWFHRRISDGRSLSKTIIQRFKTKGEAFAVERDLILQWINNPLCMNERTPAPAAPRSSRTPRQPHHPPAPAAPPPPQIAHPTPAPAAPITVIEPSIEPSGNRKKKEAADPEDVDPQVYADFKALRLAKRAPITGTAVAGIRREAAKAGFSLQQAMEMACERGWAGFKADWVKDRGGGSKQGALEARNAAVAAEVEEMFKTAR